MPVVPTIGDHVGDDGRRRLDPACAGALERDLADRVALQHDGVERALDRRERVVARRRTPGRRGRRRGRRRALARPISFTCISSARAAATWSSVTPSIPSTSTHSSGTREPNATVARIAVFAAASRPADVLGRIGLGEAEPLRLGERVAVRASLLHRGEDEVRRPVDDPEHAVDVRDDERLAQHLDHRDRGAHGRLEAQLHAARGRGLEQLGAAAGDELLVRRHDRSPGAQQLEHVVAGRLDAAHHLGDDLDRRVAEDRARSRR